MMKLYLKIVIALILIILSLLAFKAITERTGLLSEGLLLGFIFLMFGSAAFVAILGVEKYFEEIDSPK